MGECLLDEPQEHSYPLDEMPPGAFYDAAEQCTFLFGPTYINLDALGVRYLSLKHVASGHMTLLTIDQLEVRNDWYNYW